MTEDERPRNDGNTPEKNPTLPSTQKSGVRPLAWLKGILRGRASNTNFLQDAIDDYIEELKETDQDDVSADSQKELIANVLNTRDLRVSDVMVPRADIVAIDVHSTILDLREATRAKLFSRLPVYDGDLDTIIGVLHVKDVLNNLLNQEYSDFKGLAREALIVNAGLPVMELFVMMRDDKKHMALVIDEHGGIDGLVTLNDIIEAIVGDIEDEFDKDDEPQIIERSDGTIVADARVDIEDFEERYGRFLSADEREETDTLGGLIMMLAGHVPKRGEFFKHPSGMVMEVVDADARRIHRIRLKNLPAISAKDEV